MKKFLGVALAALAFSAASLPAQLPVGYTDVGIVAGLGNIGNAGLAPGARFEKVIKALPELNNGTLGIMVGVNYYSWNNRFLGTGYSLSYLPIGATGNYHFKLENKKIDAYVGLGLGYQIINCNYEGLGDVCSNSAIYFIGRVGGRYFYKPNMAFYADAGAGDATLNLGVMFKLSGKK